MSIKQIKATSLSLRKGDKKQPWEPFSRDETKDEGEAETLESGIKVGVTVI